MVSKFGIQWILLLWLCFAGWVICAPLPGAAESNSLAKNTSLFVSNLQSDSEMNPQAVAAVAATIADQRPQRYQDLIKLSVAGKDCEGRS
ncbi:hypothetical protein BT96DRAFT_925874 [Gymnopus androsaceus JB14]|uniref:Uncharacterized protein n=1 Tax=Gymnopus androsaceus JB14 TaxID=1447944 RepID=A0A6A4GYA3_9AGAR|nr:hypothetical protein BT96DRAFT_925874 [Gymnopus androsaceus JB14]